MKIRLIGAVWLALGCFLGLGGCGGGSDPPGTSNVNQANNAPSISGKTYSFTVTAAQGLTDPVGSTYSIAFDNGNTFTYQPSPQNIERTNTVTGQYTFDPNTGTAHLTSTGEPVTGTFNFTSPTTGTVHWMETDGEMQDASFMQL